MSERRPRLADYGLASERVLMTKKEHGVFESELGDLAVIAVITALYPAATVVTIGVAPGAAKKRLTTPEAVIAITATIPMLTPAM